jgi:hypothetical protein
MGAAQGVGMLANMYVGQKQMDDQAHSELVNQFGLQAQARDAQDVFDRRLKLLKNNQDKYLGSLDSDFAKAGIDFSGSFLEIYSQTKSDMREEQSAVRAEAASVQNRFQNEINMSRERRDALTDPTTRSLTLLGGAMSVGGTQAARGKT